MSPSGGQSCHVCGCSWNVHMHVTYDMTSVFKPGEDEAARKRYQVRYYRVLVQSRKRISEDGRIWAVAAL